jgi:hypothetical protein
MAGKNTIVRSISPKSVFEDAINVTSTTADFDQGDVMIFDDTNNVIRKPTTEAECATLLGIARVSVIDGKMIGPYQGLTDAVPAIANLPGPVAGVIARMVAKTGDALAPGDLLYFDPATSTRGVTVSGTKAIGVYQGPTIASAAAGQEVEVFIGHRFPADSLKF